MWVEFVLVLVPSLLHRSSVEHYGGTAEQGECMHKTQEHGILLSSQNSLRASVEEGVLSILSGITNIAKFKFNLKTVPNGTAFFFSL